MKFLFCFKKGSFGSTKQRLIWNCWTIPPSQLPQEALIWMTGYTTSVDLIYTVMVRCNLMVNCDWKDCCRAGRSLQGGEAAYGLVILRIKAPVTWREFILYSELQTSRRF